MSRIRTLLAGAALATAVVLGTALPAAAHDDLVGSTPTAGEMLATPPASVTLSYSADVLTIGALVSVVDASGTDWAAGEPVIEMTDVTTPLKDGMPAGAYEIRWRVVSSDGHPISGLVPFTVEASAVTEVVPSPTPEVTAAATSEPEPEASAVPVADDAQDSLWDSPVARTIAIAGAGAIVALGLFLGISFFRRRRKAVGSTDEKQ